MSAIPGINTGGGGLSNSSGVSGDDKQSWGGSSFGGANLSGFGATTINQTVPTWVWVAGAIALVFFLLKRGR